ncbi:MAG: YeaH/YhbH family protein [Pseudomonadales bacterium]
MSYVIDRRLNQKQKSTVNRQRFMERYRKHIKKAVEEAVNKRSITDVDSGEKISIPKGDVSEPIFTQGSGGEREQVHPRNKEFITGDRIARPPSGGGKGSKASNQGEGDDEFQFQISHDEFLNVMFDGLELPNLVKRHLAGSDVFKTVRAGFSQEGNPNQINIVRSLRSAQARRIALVGKDRRRIREIEAQLSRLSVVDENDESAGDMAVALLPQALSEQREALEAELKKSRTKVKSIPWLDTFDLKYNLHTKHPVPRSKAVMFCIMDVSGSMNQATKDMAKRFFILLYLFLQRNYDQTDVVFIRHHTSAKEVDEQEFFYSRETGGTIVSSALYMMKDIIEDRYPAEQWNVYGAQASDGDNWNDDSSTCHQLLCESIMPLVQHYSYVEITPRDHQALWSAYQQVQGQFPDHFAMQNIVEARDIYPVFRELFQRKEA